MSDIHAEILEAIEACEEYADELFDGEEHFTQVTKWQDGDFRVMVWRGMGYEEHPYRQEAERITFIRQDDGWIRYSKITRKIDHHVNDFHDQQKLERLFDDG